ncbi:MAG: porin family protein [Balneolaceae bacterium]
MKKLITLFSFLIVSAFSLEALAQDYNLQNRTGFGLHLGHYQAQDAEEGSMFVGVQLRSIGEMLGAELSAEYRGDQRYRIEGGDLTVRQIPVTGSLLLFIPVGESFAPYGLAGLGVYYTVYDYDEGFLDPGDETYTNFGYHLGLGADIAVSEDASINVDYRYLFLDGNNESLDNKSFSGNLFTAGITFYF